MAQKQTPFDAPWSLGKCKEGDAEICDASGSGFATVRWDTGDDEEQPYESDAEVVATVNLICAAPDLLAACKDAMAIIERLIEQRDGAGWMPSPRVVKIRAAIARAEGK